MAAFSIWLAGAAAYLVLAGSFSLDELVVAAVLGVAGLGWHAAVLHDGGPRFAFERPALRLVGAALLGFPAATGRVGVRLAQALARPVEGRRVERPFHRGKLRDPRDGGRRAVVVLTSSFAPDSYAVALPLDEQVIAFHSLSGAAPGGDPRWPA